MVLKCGHFSSWYPIVDGGVQPVLDHKLLKPMRSQEPRIQTHQIDGITHQEEGMISATGQQPDPPVRQEQ